MNRVWVRTAILGIVVVALVAVAVCLRNRPQGLPITDIPPVDSVGYIAALLEKDGETRLVAISPDGTIREAQGGSRVVDHEPAWKPDGRRVVFVSNRTSTGSIQVFEWAPDRDGEPIQLTPNGASRQNPWFAPDGNAFYYASGGDVLMTTYPQLKSRRVMPPSRERDGVETESGHVHAPGEDHEHDLVSSVWTAYSAAIQGEAFRQAYVDGTTLLGVYSTARGQALIIQELEPHDEAGAIPQAPFAGSALDVSFHAGSGLAVVAVLDFRFPNLAEVPQDAIQPDGSVKTPFHNALFAVGLRNKSVVPIFVAPDDSQALVSPAISPDGLSVVFLIVEPVGGAKRVSGMLVAPIEEGGVQKARPLTQGEISDPSWSPDGSRIAFVRDGDIYTIGADGSGETKVTNGEGRFSTPLFSPMR